MTGTLSWAQLRREARDRLATALGGDRSQEAQWIVERVSGYTRAELLANSDELVSARAVAFFDQMLARREAGEPLQYVLGRWAFRSLELLVDRRALIPRPETELVAGLAIDAALAAAPPALVADLGTGTGAIGLSVVTEVPGSQVWITDADAGALALATANLAGLGRPAARVRTALGSWFDALPAEQRGSFDVIVSNPPYVRTDAELEPIVREWEPHRALFAGPDGLDDIRVIVAGAGEWLRRGGTVVVELSPEQADAAVALCAAAGLVDAHVEADLTGRLRALVARRP